MQPSQSAQMLEPPVKYGDLSDLLVQLQQSQKIQALEQTLYKTEHQLRTPLSLIELYADLLQQNLSDNPLKAQAQSICKIVQEINTSLKRLMRLDAFSLAEQRQYNLGQVVAESIEDLQPCLAQQSISIVCEQASLMLTGDSWQMKQVFTNLFSNAIAFSPENATIACQWRLTQDEVLIEICDQGPGFSPHDLANLFTPFYSRRQNGTGLGLVIARDIIQAHQGRLWADNLPSGGAIISIALPRG